MRTRSRAGPPADTVSPAGQPLTPPNTCHLAPLLTRGDELEPQVPAAVGPGTRNDPTRNATNRKSDRVRRTKCRMATPGTLESVCRNRSSDVRAVSAWRATFELGARGQRF